MSQGKIRPRKGELAGVLDAVAAWLDAHDIGAFWGYETNDAPLPQFNWDPSGKPVWESFLQLAKRCGVPLVAVDCDSYSRERLDNESIADEDREQAESLFQKLEIHEDEIVHITLKWIRDGVVYCCVISSDWADDFHDLEQLIGEPDAEYEDEVRGTLTDEEVEQHAKTLAFDGSFQAARTNAQRTYAAKKAFGGTLPDYNDLNRVIDQARNLYELEIKPEKEAKLGEEIRRLRAEGLKTNEIAQRLGIPTQKVRDLG